MRRFILSAACLTCLAALGCVEGEQTFTLNPDGSGKLKLDVTMTPPFDLNFGAQPKKADEQTLDELLVSYVSSMFRASGVTAWKDVTASFAPDGRLKFAGTAYFKKLDDLQFQNMSLIGSGFGATAGPEGSLTLAAKKKQTGDADRGPWLKIADKTPAELALMPDAQVDALVMKERVKYQSFRPILVAMLSDAKLKTTYVLPGSPSPLAGFTAKGNTLSNTLDGAKILAGVNEVYGMDAAGLRKLVRSADGAATLEEMVIGFAPADSARIAVAKTTGSQFDFDKEVKEARAAYPELRKKLKLPDSVPPNDGTNPVPKSGSIPK